MPRGSTVAASPSATITRYGQRSHRHSAQGANPSQVCETQAIPKAAPAATALTKAIVRVVGTDMPRMCSRTDARASGRASGAQQTKQPQSLGTQGFAWKSALGVAAAPRTQPPLIPQGEASAFFRSARPFDDLIA